MSRILLFISLAAAACVAWAAPSGAHALPAYGKASTVAALQPGAVDKLQQRLRDLEDKVLQLQQQAQHDQEALEEGRRRQAELEVAAHAMPWLLGLVVALAAVAVALAWRVQSLTRRRQEAWWDTSAPMALDVEAPRDEAPNTAAVVFNEPAAQHDAPSRPPLSAPLATAVLSVDEQLALSQQVSLLCALGHDDKAVELLLSRMEQGGRTPWLLLKLLSLYQRSGQRAAYDKLARQVALRFGCTLPAWDAPAQPGLEADPALLQTLQQSWESPVDALQTLAKMLLKPQSLPSLAACEDMLLLYRVAHERHRQEVASCGEVDLLLPLAPSADDAKSSSASPSLFLPGLRAELQPAP